MLRRVLILSLGILATACVPPPAPVVQLPAPPAPPPTISQQPTLPPPIRSRPVFAPSRTRQIPVLAQQPRRPVARFAICDGSAQSFVNSIQVLKPSYSPNVPAGQYRPPQTIPDYVLRDEIKQDLSDAFTNAPLFFRQHLCDLDGIYISTAGCTGDANNCALPSNGAVFGASWGFRSHYQNAADVGNEYIAISAGLWPADGTGHSHALLFQVFENALLQNLAPWGGFGVLTPSDPNTSWITILAALAHEFGHVYWADMNISPPDGNNPPPGTYDFGRLQSCSTGDFFGYWDYHNSRQLQSSGRWRGFNDRGNAAGVRLDHEFLPLLAQFDDQGLTSDEKNDLLLLLYQPHQPWPSYFGSVSPEEQFVETYVFHVLIGNKRDYNNNGPYLRSLPVTLTYTDGPPQVVDVPKDFFSVGKPNLNSKIDCIGQ